MRRLLVANLLLLGLLLVHVADHSLRQPPAGALGFPANVPGILGVFLVLAPLPLILLRSRFAAPVAALAGGLTAVGFVVVHLVPTWSVFSDPYYERTLDAVSWLQMLSTAVAGLLLVYDAWRVGRAARGAGLPRVHSAR